MRQTIVIFKNTIYFLSLKNVLKLSYNALTMKRKASLVLEPPEDLPPKPIKITSSIMKMKGGKQVKERLGF